MKKQLLSIVCATLSFSAFAQTTVTFNYTGAAQTFTVPACVTSLTIEARGAQGGAVTGQSPYPQGGLGATMIGDFTVTPGDMLTLIVGGRGNSDPSSSGGGGGSGVNLNGNPLIVAGGGAGVDFQDPYFAGQDAVITSTGVTGNGGGGAGGSGGSAGGDNMYTSTNISRGGNGWNDGNTGSMGANGLSTNTTFTNGTWGLGGGGGSVGYGWCNCGGGGGGYSGGGSGQINQTGGGGGSYNIGTNQNNTAGNNTGDGMIIITYTISGSAPSSPTSISGSSSVCVGSGSLTYTISSVVGATGYTWTVPAGSSITSGQGTTSIVMQPGSTSGNITVTADNSCGSSAPTTFTLTINALPTVTASAATSTICSGSSDVLTASGASTYVWSSGGTNATETVSPTTMTTYTVTGTDANGCSNTATVMVNVNALPTVAASAATSSICMGDSDVLTATGASTYAWSSGGTNATETVTPTTMTTYTVTGTDANGCVNTATVMVNVNALPNVTATAATSSICIGDSDVLTASGASTYAWSSGGTNATETVTPTTMTNYTVTGTDANGCVNTATVTVNVNSLPIVDLGNDVTQCGGSVIADANNQGASYLWNTGATTQFITITTSGVYYVDVTNGNGCSSSDTVAVTINALPTVTGTATSNSVCLNDASVALTGTPAGGTWSGPGVTASSFSPMSAGVGAQTLTYSYTDANGCSNTATVVITVNGCAGVVEQTLMNGVSVYPNPNNGLFTLAVNANVGDLKIVITDLQGRVVYSSVENNVAAGYTQQINLQSESAGMYLLQISGNGEQRVDKITVQK